MSVKGVKIMKKTLSLLLFQLDISTFVRMFQQQKLKLALKMIRIRLLVVYLPNPEDLIEETIPAFEENMASRLGFSPS